MPEGTNRGEEMSGLFQYGDFVLASGQQSRFKIECDYLLPSDIDFAAWAIRRIVGPFSSVEGVPQGGLRLADALCCYQCKEGPHLVVDDVWTTGGSILKVMESHPRCKAAVIFARGPLSHGVKAVFQLNEGLWL